MTCRYCGSTNDTDAHRCIRCGRRLHLASARPAPETYPVAGALAPQVRSLSLVKESGEAAPQAERGKRNPVQATLFQTREVGRVVPIQLFQRRSANGGSRSARAEKEKTQASHPNALVELQQQAYFEFPVPATPRRGAEHARYSKAPVAIPLHRVMAAMLDFSLVLISVGMVAILLYVMLGRDFVEGSTLSFFALMGAFFALGYKLMWALAGVESPGLRWTQLRLLTWDGSEPSREDRLRRLAWGCVSVLPAGLGLLWALVDEETLSWHDHSSKTFLTSYTEQAGRR